MTRVLRNTLYQLVDRLRYHNKFSFLVQIPARSEVP